MNGTETKIDHDPSSTARAEASLWIVRLHGPQRSPALEDGFREWLAADPANAREFEYVTEMWDAAPGLAQGGLPRVAQWQQKPRLLPLASAAAVVLACATLAFSAYRLWFAPSPSYITAVGEQRSVRLDDGTRISLNSTTRLQVNFDARERSVTLQAGEAFFEVGRDATRPFVVNAGDRRITALGTSFIVRYEADRMAVALIEGRVSVTPPTSSSAAAQLLSPGERLTVPAGKPAQLDKPRMDVLTAWRRGEVILDRTPLADAIAEMNRYDKTQLTVQDAALGELRVSGVYKTGDSESFARAAARMLGLTVTEKPGQLSLRR